MRAEGGFTLLEVLVALAVLGMIIGSAFSALWLGSRSWDAGLVRADQSSAQRAVPAFLQRQFSQVVPLQWGGEMDSAIAFEGGQRAVRFVAPAPQRQRGSGLYEFLLESRRGLEGVSLVLYYQPFRPDAKRFGVSVGSSHSVLLEGAGNVSFSFYGAARKGAPRGWQRDWKRDRRELPTLIRLQIERGAAGRRWPELIIPLRAGLEQI